jgi:hypothetical protein
MSKVVVDGRERPEVHVNGGGDLLHLVWSDFYVIVDRGMIEDRSIYFRWNGERNGASFGRAAFANLVAALGEAQEDKR